MPPTIELVYIKRFIYKQKAALNEHAIKITKQKKERKRPKRKQRRDSLAI